MVVDALDLCYTKAHVDAFVIISGDSDFSPLVSKLRENNKTVIGVGVRSSTSELLVNNCDEFIFYDELVKADEARKKAAARKANVAAPVVTGKSVAAESGKRGGRTGPGAAPAAAPAETVEESRRNQAIELVVDTVEALVAETNRDEFHASQVKVTLKRRRPDFLESAYGYKAFGKILEDAEKKGLLELHRAEKTVTVTLPRG